MSTSGTPLPEYDLPPVAEVVMSAAFERMESLNTVEVGLMWRELFASDLPEIQEKGEVAVQFERLQYSPAMQPTVSFQAMDTPPWPRLWFLSTDGGRLMQFQRDWVASNWRRTPDRDGDEYPRYPVLIDRFRDGMQRFLDYVAQRGLGKVVFTQSELTYINHIDLGELGVGPGDIASVLGIAAVPQNDPFLPPPEGVQLSASYLMEEQGEAIGRLYVQASPALRKEGGQPLLILNLSAKGPPRGDQLEDVIRFMDVAREWIVRGFTNITRPEMHVKWRRNDG